MLGLTRQSEHEYLLESRIFPPVGQTVEGGPHRIDRNDAGRIGKLPLADPTQTTCTIRPIEDDGSGAEAWTLRVKRGQTVTARVVLSRTDDFASEVSFGKEKSGRNATHGLYVDNIGLNGLLVLKNANEREFFLTADQAATPGKRSFFLTANVDGGVTSHPITVEVLP